MMWKLRSVVLAFALLTISAGAALAQNPTLASDQDDYMPGETVTLTGAGWMPGESVTIVFHENPVTHADLVLSSSADASGEFTNSAFAPEPHDVGVAFTVTATGSSSGWTAQASFTDAGPANMPVPQPLPYQQDFSALPWSSGCPSNVNCGSEVWPPGWEGWRIGPATITSFFTGGSGAADENLRSFGDASVIFGGVYNYLGKVGFLCSGTVNAAVVLALDTRGRSGVALRFDLETIRNPWVGNCVTPATGGVRVNFVDVQYRLDTGSSWTSLSGNPNGVYSSVPQGPKTSIGDTSPQNAQTITLTLPPECSNQPLVQIRWVQRDQTNTPDNPQCGPRPSFAIDNVTANGVPIGCLADVTPPTIECPGPITRLVDAGQCTAAVNFTVNASDNCSPVNVVSVPASGFAFPIGTTTVTSTATDASGNTTSCDFTVTVSNPAPSVAIAAPASGTVVAVNTPVAMSGTFTDNAGDVHTAVWSFDGVPGADVVTIAGDGTVSGTVTSTHSFSAAGVYLAKLTVTDQCGGAGSSSTIGGLDALIVVYDPNAGFVTGGGWINSPAGAYAPNPSLADRANFGFVSKYKKGASTATGETEFQFKLAGLDFHASVYEWLVIAGAKAQYKGSGTINGTGDYGFMLTAIDGMYNGGPDLFRIKIVDRVTSAVVYDNQTGAGDNSDPTTAIAGGSIVVHAGPVGGSGASITSLRPHDDAVPSSFALAPATPNPFTSGTELSFSLPKAARVVLGVYDVSGREVARLVDGEMPAGVHATGWSGRDHDGHAAPGGMYFVRITAHSSDGAEPYQETRRIALVR